MKIRNFNQSLLNLGYKIEDFMVRSLVSYPLQKRRDSYPFLSSDSFYFLSDFRIEETRDILELKRANRNSVIYLNGNKIPELAPKLTTTLRESGLSYRRLLIGDSDHCPEFEFILQIEKYFDQIFTVNLSDEISQKVKLLPLGLESQRYRSAGQLRDFVRLPDFNLESRDIEILIAWNDKTCPETRTEARQILRQNPLSFELINRETARYIHQLMRRAKIVPCPRGNGLDTHRFWESLYLGALPVVLEKDSLPGLSSWPHWVVSNWEELLNWNKDKIMEIYKLKLPELIKFRHLSKLEFENLCR